MCIDPVQGVVGWKPGDSYDNALAESVIGLGVVTLIDGRPNLLLVLESKSLKIESCPESCHYDFVVNAINVTMPPGLPRH